MKRIILVVTVITFAVCSFAQFSGSGSGTANDPYLIFNPIQLDQVRNFLNNNNVYFKMMADIDLEEFIADNYPTQGWLPIGTSTTPFSGHFDGNGKIISNLTINRPTTQDVGFFGCIGAAIISNVTIDEANVIGSDYTGGLIGRVFSSSGRCSINNTCTHGTIVGNENVGGLIGRIGNTSYSSQHIITNCSTNVNINGSNNIGGLNFQ